MIIPPYGGYVKSLPAIRVADLPAIRVAGLPTRWAGGGLVFPATARAFAETRAITVLKIVGEFFGIDN
jgi:hypothetical protein